MPFYVVGRSLPPSAAHMLLLSSIVCLHNIVVCTVYCVFQIMQNDLLPLTSSCSPSVCYEAHLLHVKCLLWGEVASQQSIPLRVMLRQSWRCHKPSQNLYKIHPSQCMSTVCLYAETQCMSTVCLYAETQCMSTVC